MRHLSFAIIAAAFVFQACAAQPHPIAPAPPEPPRLLAAGLDTKPLAVGSRPPDFEARAHDGSIVHLSALAGREVVLFFYTQDETPLSEREAMDLRDQWPDYAKRGVMVIGISRDTLGSHVAFAQNHRLPFPLVSDESGELTRAFGVPAPYGIGDRQTFVIGRDGAIKNIYRTVDVVQQPALLRADLEGS